MIDTWLESVHSTHSRAELTVDHSHHRLECNYASLHSDNTL